MKRALHLLRLFLPILLLTVCIQVSNAQSTAFTPQCLDSATVASVQTILSTVGQAFGLAGATTTDISNAILARMDRSCGLGANITTLQNQVAGLQAQIVSINAAIKGLSTTGGTTTPPGGGTTTPPTKMALGITVTVPTPPPAPGHVWTAWTAATGFTGSINLVAGAKYVVTGGPMTANGSVWWQVTPVGVSNPVAYWSASTNFGLAQ